MQNAQAPAAATCRINDLRWANEGYFNHLVRELSPAMDHPRKLVFAFTVTVSGLNDGNGFCIGSACGE